jgi:hypothetical protein
MSILKDLEKIGKDIESDVEKIAATLEKDLQKATDAIENGMKKLADFLEKGFDAAEQKIINDLKKDVLDKYSQEITALQNLRTMGLTSVDTNSVIDDIKNMVSNNGAAIAAQDVLSNIKTPEITAQYGAFSAFKSMTLGCDAEIDLIFGVSAGGWAGMNIPIPEPENDRILINFNANGGVEEGAEVGLCIGVWIDSPKHLGGGCIAVTLGADEGAGAGIILCFSLSADPEFTGVVLNINAGEEIEASIDCGYTLALKIPA